MRATPKQIYSDRSHIPETQSQAAVYKPVIFAVVFVAVSWTPREPQRNTPRLPDHGGETAPSGELRGCHAQSIQPTENGNQSNRSRLSLAGRVKSHCTGVPIAESGELQSSASRPITRRLLFDHVVSNQRNQHQGPSVSKGQATETV